MPASSEHKEAVKQHVREALIHIPDARPNDLPPTKPNPGVPDWHGFEHELWRLGEEVRQLINQKTSLRGDRELYSSFLEIARNRACMRGRQSWILLFAYKPCGEWAEDVAALLPDSDIDGHVISALYKMKSSGFSEQVAPFQESKTTWIRKEAMRYVDFDQSQNKSAHANPLPLRS